ncbi:transcription elongation factor GreA [Patescibacteria group bacterium]|nr:transcription elongation factor GreA [Patescibacteria group bacterium]
MAKFVTKEGLEKMKEELEYLKTTKQKELSERLRKAIAFGDLSENFEYSDAKDAQAMLQAKIAELGDEIRSAKVVENNDKTDKVQIGSTVEVDAGGSKMILTIVTAAEADPVADKVSAESPIAACLIGKKVGEKCIAELPAGPMEYKILRIS